MLLRQPFSASRSSALQHRLLRPSASWPITVHNLIQKIVRHLGVFFLQTGKQDGFVGSNSCARLRAGTSWRRVNVVKALHKLIGGDAQIMTYLGNRTLRIAFEYWWGSIHGESPHKANGGG